MLILPTSRQYSPTKKEGGSIDSKLIQEVRLEQRLNMLLKQNDYQREYPVECNNRCSSMCRQCLYNVESVILYASKYNRVGGFRSYLIHYVDLSNF